MSSFRQIILFTTIIDDLIFSFVIPAFLLFSVSNDFPDFYENDTKNQKKIGRFYVTPPILAPREQKIVSFPNRKTQTLQKARSRLRFKILSNILQIEDESRSRTSLNLQNRTRAKLPDVY